MKPIAITSGEPAGIGPDILLNIAMRSQSVPLVAIADIDLLHERARQLDLNIQLKQWRRDSVITTGSTAETRSNTSTLWVDHIPLRGQCEAGTLNPMNSEYVLALLDTAYKGTQKGRFSAMVTAPIQKSVINEAGIPFSGHTEYLQEKAGVEKVVMMLASPKLRVALVTTHLPLRQVADAITKETLTQVVRILHSDLRDKFGIPSPRILVCGLNPHAGEGGHLGTEEIELIDPTLDDLRAEGIDLIGSLPADTLFTPKYVEHADAVLAMYHDQGLPVLKAQGFGESINITLGLPFIRTSVDHGTALDLAGTGRANSSSLQVAIDTAAQMIKARAET